MRHDHWIGGKADAPASAEYLPTIDPTTRAAGDEIAAGTAPDVAATITSDAHDFVSWATHRRKWSECVEIEGDEPYASTVLDAMHIF